MKQRSFLGSASSTGSDPAMVRSIGHSSGIALTNSASNRSENNKENNIMNKSANIRTSSSVVSNGHPVKLVGDSLINTNNLMRNTEDLLISTISKTAISSSDKDRVPHPKSGMQSSVRKNRSMDMILSGNIPRTYDNNHTKNNPYTSAAASSSSLSSLAKDRIINNEIELLLNKKSSHADEANNEWFDGYSKRLTQLSKREYAQTKAAQVQSIEIQAFCCMDSNECNLSKQDRLVEQFPTYCHSKGHLIERFVAIKRFFECKQCNKRECTLTKKKDIHTKVILPPEVRCIVCGAYRWTLCGQRGSGPLDVSMKEADSSGPKMDPTIRGGQLFLSATDWTKKKDSVSMAERVSRLQ